MNDARHIVPDHDQVVPSILQLLPMTEQISLSAHALVNMSKLVDWSAIELHLTEHGVYQ